MNQIQKQLSSLSSWCEGVDNLTGKCWDRIYKKGKEDTNFNICEWERNFFFLIQSEKRLER